MKIAYTFDGKNFIFSKEALSALILRIQATKEFCAEMDEKNNRDKIRRLNLESFARKGLV